MKIAITGHRPNKLGNDYNLTSPLIQAIKQNILEILGTIQANEQLDVKDITLITGMALGIDTLFAQIAVENNIPFIAAIPFEGQNAIWPVRSKIVYNQLLDKAKQVINVTGQVGYKPEYMQLRNQWMVDNCDTLIAVWDGTPGGTANCVQYATNKKRIIRIDPKTVLT